MVQPISLDHQQDDNASNRARGKQNVQLKQFSQATAEGENAALIKISDKGYDYHVSHRVIDW